LAARHPQWQPRTLDGFLDACASEFGERPLVLTDDRTLTYRECANSTDRPQQGALQERR
jgi:fatty-acyl-CoA synthase